MLLKKARKRFPALSAGQSHGPAHSYTSKPWCIMYADHSGRKHFNTQKAYEAHIESKQHKKNASKHPEIDPLKGNDHVYLGAALTRWNSWQQGGGSENNGAK
jgi:hypothetical protein